MEHGSILKMDIIMQIIHREGFEPSSTNTLELESSPLDRSGTDAYPLLAKVFVYNFVVKDRVHNTKHFDCKVVTVKMYLF